MSTKINTVLDGGRGGWCRKIWASTAALADEIHALSVAFDGPTSMQLQTHRHTREERPTSMQPHTPKSVPTRDHGPGGISSEHTSLRRLGVLFSSYTLVLSLSHGEVPSHRRSNFASVSQELRRKQNKWNSRHSKFSNRHMPNGTTTAVQHPPKAHLGLPTTSWLRSSSFDKPSCPYVGQ